ncbi:phospholipid:lipid A palmitoyltransferase, partial [Erwinia amylovora]|nr:phospholipid:lipid A palmitoyltransferase [Erwinia amylovora]
MNLKSVLYLLLLLNCLCLKSSHAATLVHGIS